jgi:hypothetical protein
MNAKQNYVAPEMELVKIQTEGSLLVESTLGGSTSSQVEVADYHEDVAW